jgi:hypothetical protein
MASAQTTTSARRERRRTRGGPARRPQAGATARTESRPPAKPTKADSKPLRPDAEHKEPLQIQILEKMSQLMTAALGLIAALAWNEAMKLLLAQIFADNQALRVAFGYAAAITILAVILSLWVANVTHKVKAALGHGHPPTTA